MDEFKERDLETVFHVIWYRLLQELLDSQRTYQALLKQGLEEHKLQIQVLAQMMQQLNLVTGGTKSRTDTG